MLILSLTDPLNVNFIAFDKKFKIIYENLFLSVFIKAFSGNSFISLIFFFSHCICSKDVIS